MPRGRWNKQVWRAHGSPFWHEVADSQRVPDGRIMCPLCDRLWPRDLEGELEMDRIVPAAEGGIYELENCQLTCPTCNKRKHNRPQEVARADCLDARAMTAYERYTNDDLQRERSNARSKRWQARNRDAVLERDRKRLADNRAAENARAREYYNQRKKGKKPKDNPPLFEVG